MSVRALVDRWRAHAENLQRYAPEVATAIGDCAGELEAALRAADDETLTLEQAAAESGYSRDALRHLVASGQIPNAGRKHAPRVRRGDLPRKRTPRRSVGRYDVEQDARHLARQIIDRTLSTKAGGSSHA